ncbi:hypothetical protein FXF51_43470 [Nonomuraea sp. PA05]|uniref:hypothetical protein n=1 Tax=Nonomuraea sp. PA05 TaxID=2604466 RepID=UPI0011D6ABB9|nr:hypothetical protein [Nonomuraea sp. PA05]TYB56632.1 hypothetical protein FXF51_43470 [Nonomuraea sp. PA05]
MTGPRLAGNALAAATAAVAASYLGVAGTVLGAALMTVGTTAGTAVYAHYLERTGELKRLPWGKVAVTTGLVFAISMGGVLAYQTVAGKTVSEQLTGKPARKSARPEPTRGRDKDAEPGISARRMRTVATPVGSRSATPEATSTPALSVTTTITATPAPAGEPTPTPVPADTIGASGSPSQSPAPGGSVPAPQHLEPAGRTGHPPAVPTTTPDEARPFNRSDDDPPPAARMTAPRPSRPTSVSS